MAGPKLHSNSAIFARRGDPWLSEREAVKQFNRTPEHEQPDLDQYLRATKAANKPKGKSLHSDLLPKRSNGLVKKTPKSQEPAHRLANAGNKLRLRFKELGVKR